MGVQESLNTFFYYPLTSVIDVTKKVGSEVIKMSGLQRGVPTTQVQLPPNLQNLDVSTLVHMGNPIIRVAAVSGAAALVLGAYGAHTLPTKANYEERRNLYEIANRYHFYSTLALFGVPLCRYPKLTACIMMVGMFFFCGASYHHALTGKSELTKLTPVGAVTLIIGWLLMVL